MVSGEDKATLLSHVSMFSSLEEGELTRIAEVAVPRNYVPGEQIVREGDRGDTCFIVCEGKVRVVRAYSGGRAITLAVLGAGAIFGELAMFDGETRSATVEAVEPTAALAILAGDMRRILLAHPGTGVKLLAGLADRLRAANEQIARLSFQTVSGRVASALLGQIEGREELDGDGDGGGGDVVISATQTDIAQLAGSSRESASRFLAELERAGLVTTGRGRVVVHEPAALRNYIY